MLNTKQLAVIAQIEARDDFVRWGALSPRTYMQLPEPGIANLIWERNDGVDMIVRIGLRRLLCNRVMPTREELYAKLRAGK